MSIKGDRAEQLFLEGYNCSQAVAGAFADEIGLPFEKVIMLISGFGGGFSRAREVCGTVSGGVFVLSALYGYTDVNNASLKKNCYTVVRRLMELFKNECGSCVCRELLGLKAGEDTSLDHISHRTGEFYGKRPCPRLCKIAAELTEQVIDEVESGKLALD